jgi:hypothetical protein
MCHVSVTDLQRNLQAIQFPRGDILNFHVNFEAAKQLSVVARGNAPHVLYVPEFFDVLSAYAAQFSVASRKIGE